MSFRFPRLTPSQESFSLNSNFDGVTYERIPHQLVADGIPSRVDRDGGIVNNTVLVYNALGGDLRPTNPSRAATTGPLSGIISSDSL